MLRLNLISEEQMKMGLEGIIRVISMKRWQFPIHNGILFKRFVWFVWSKFFNYENRLFLIMKTGYF